MPSLNVATPVVRLMDVPIHQIRMQTLLDYCEQAIREHSSMTLGMVNVAKLVQSRKNRPLYRSLAGSDLVAPDGQGVVMLSRLAGKALPERVAGIDVMYGLLERANRKGYRVFFLGAKPDVVKEVVRRAAETYPNLGIAGYADGYFDLDQDGETIAEQVRDSSADILFVAITPPKKEFFLDRWKQVMNVPVCHGVGGSFDVFAGRTRRAPRWMQKIGLEWLYRIIQEPRRMWKRYLVTNTAFLFLSIREIVGTRLGIIK